MHNKVNTFYDHELQHLIDLSGLQDKRIAEDNGITCTYLSRIKTGDRLAESTRSAIKQWLINYIKNYIEFKFKLAA